MADNIFTKLVEAVVPSEPPAPVNYVYPGDVRSEATIDEVSK